MGFKPTNGGGIDQLTGEVTAGPGTGSQAATIAPVTTAGSIGGATAVPEITYNAAGQITGVASIAPDDTSKVPLAGGTMTGQLIVPDLSVSGLTGATAASRYVGATASGAPTAGTFAVGDFVIDQTGKVWVCTTAGTPGTWTQVGGGALTSYSINLGADVTLAGSTPVNIGSQALPIGTFLIVATATLLAGGSASNLTDLWLGPNSASVTGAYIVGEGADGTASSYYQVTLKGIVTLTVATTVYLSLQCQSANTLKALAAYATTNATGGVIVQIA